MFNKWTVLSYSISKQKGFEILFILWELLDRGIYHEMDTADRHKSIKRAEIRGD